MPANSNGYLTPTHVNRITSFTVDVYANGTNFSFQVSDDLANDLSSKKMIRGVLCDALATWIAAEAADLTTNGDSDVVNWNAYRGTENAVAESKVTWDFANKKVTLALSSAANLSVTDITVTSPFASVYSCRNLRDEYDERPRHPPNFVSNQRLESSRFLVDTTRSAACSYARRIGGRKHDLLFV